MNRIKQLRKEKGLNQRQLAEIIGVSRAAIAYYETDQRTPRIEYAKKLANYFNTDVSYILGLELPVNLKFATKQEAIDFIHKIMKAQNIKLEDITDESKR